MDPTSRAILLLIFTATVSLVGLVFVVWLFQAWRRGLRRGKPKLPGGPGADSWQIAGQRLRLDDADRDEQS